MQARMRPASAQVQASVQARGPASVRVQVQAPARVRVPEQVSPLPQRLRPRQVLPLLPPLSLPQVRHRVLS